MARDEFANGVKRALCERVAAVCSNPDCRVQTVGPSAMQSGRSVKIGVAAHIYGAAPGGPRYDDKQDREARRSIENGIWLCQNCADLVDSNGGSDFDANALMRWKRDAELAALANLGKRDNILLPWKHGLANLSYVNVPRLSILAGLNALPPSVPPLEDVRFLHDLGSGLVRLMLDYEKVIEALHVAAVDIRRLQNLEDGIEGLTIGFEDRFYTKNGPDLPGQNRRSDLVSSDWRKAPHVYSKLPLRPWKLVLAIDPRWITTTTAFGQFRSRQVKFCGIALVKEVSLVDRIVFASPYFLGLKRTVFDDM